MTDEAQISGFVRYLMWLVDIVKQIKRVLFSILFVVLLFDLISVFHRSNPQFRSLFADFCCSHQNLP
jgi:hypothetical protein